MNDELDEQKKESLKESVNKHRMLNAVHSSQSPQSSNAGLEKALKKSTIKASVPPLAQAAGVPTPVTDSSLETDSGEALLEEAANEPTTVAGTAVVVSNLVSKTWLWYTIIGVSFCLFIFMIALVFLLKNSDNMNYAADNFFENENYKKLYEEVENVVSEYRSKYGVTVDKYLIIAALTALQDNSYYVDDTESGAYNYTTAEDDGYYKSLDEMTAKIEILAKYQIKTYANCSSDSSSVRKIASNDDNTNIFNFWTSAASREKNYDCSGGGTSYSLSTEKGSYDDENSGGVFYWNLIDENFMVEYYPEYFDEVLDDELYHTHLADAVDYIYLYADSLRQIDCENSGSVAGNFPVVDVTCPQVVVTPCVSTKGAHCFPDYGNYDLESYVAGVVNREFSPSYMKTIAGSNADIKENIKAFAIAIRTYTLSKTRNCTGTIENSDRNQVFKPTDDPIIWEAVNETSGVVITYNDNIISAMYDSFYNAGGTSATYTKIPSSERHTVTIPSSWRGYAAGGHGQGMSQIAALNLAVNEGKNFQEILEYFYADGIELKSMTGTSPVIGGSGSAYCQRNNNEKQEEGKSTCNGTTAYRERKVDPLSTDKSLELLSCTADQTEKAFNEISEACGTIPMGNNNYNIFNATKSRFTPSLYYVGRAFDFNQNKGMQDSNNYFYVTLDNTSSYSNSNYYRLYCEVTGKTDSKYAKDREIRPVKFNNGSFTAMSTISGKFLDVTGVLNSYGIYGVGPRECLNSGNYSCAQWWQFQDTGGLTKDKTTFADVLNQYYGPGKSYDDTAASDSLKKRWNGGGFS